MRYSEIITTHYQIKLDAIELALIDAHFLAAAHHRFHALQVNPETDLETLRFHIRLFGAHVLALLRMVASGDFSHARDPSGLGLEAPENWHKDWMDDVIQKCIGWGDIRPIEQDVLPDAGMFDGFPGDGRYAPGEPHPYDAILTRPERVTWIRSSLLRNQAAH